MTLGVEQIHTYIISKGYIMFKQRAITSVIIVLLVLGILLCAPPSIQLIFVMALIAACAWEWLALIPLTNNIYRGVYFLVMLLLAAMTIGYGDNFSAMIAGIVLASWGLIIIAILSYPMSQRIWGHAAIVALAGLIVMPLFLYGLVRIHNDYPNGKALIMYTIVLVWAADVGAYLCGKWLGRHKLIPRVSPGKSWEGALGGLLLVLMVAAWGNYYFQPQYLFCWWGTAVVLFVQSVFGDLFISVLKRRCQLKDTGQILPGHGGMLDRLDSLLAVMPLAVLLYRFCLQA